MDEADFSVKENVGKKFTIKYKATKESGPGGVKWVTKTMLSVVEIK